MRVIERLLRLIIPPAGRHRRPIWRHRFLRLGMPGDIKSIDWRCFGFHEIEAGIVSGHKLLQQTDAMGSNSFERPPNVTISSMCTVFAESEVTSLIAKGRERRAIALGLHASAMRRVAAMIQRTAPEGDIVFTGGVAANPCLRKLLAQTLGRTVLFTERSQFAGALGAALLAFETH